MMAGDAAMVVALADSLFFEIDPSAARGKVLLFLVLSFAPFLVARPVDRPRHRPDRRRPSVRRSRRSPLPGSCCRC